MSIPQQISMRVDGARYKRVSAAAKIKGLSVAKFTEAAWDAALKAAADRAELSTAATNLESEITRLSNKANEMILKQDGGVRA